MKTYQHIHAILKDGTLQIQANREKEPLRNYAIGYSYTIAEWNKWQSSHEYFPFASEDEIDELFKLIRPDQLKQGISVIDGIEIRSIFIESIGVGGEYKQLAYFKEVKDEYIEPQHDEYATICDLIGVILYNKDLNAKEIVKAVTHQFKITRK